MNLPRTHRNVSVLLLGIWSLWIPAAYGQSGTTLQGRVVLYQSDAGVAGATVNLFSDDRVRTAKTDDDGKFAFAGLTGSSHFLEASSPGFFSASLPIANQTTGPMTMGLWLGEGGQCPDFALFTYPSASYEERLGEVQLTGVVVDFSGRALPNASLNLMRANLNIPEARWPGGPPRVPSMTQRRFQFTDVVQGLGNEKGEFQFSGLEPGWYSLIVGHQGYKEQTAKFWIARESLTRTTRIHLNLQMNALGCDTIFGPDERFPIILPSYK